MECMGYVGVCDRGARHPSEFLLELACIAHRVGRPKAATCSGTAQSRVSRLDTLPAGLVFEWRLPFRLVSGLLGSAYRACSCERQGASPMALDLMQDSLTRSVSEGILDEYKQTKPLADASGFKVSAIGR